MADPLIQVLSLRGGVLIWLCWVIFFAWFKNGNNTDRSLQNQSNCTNEPISWFFSTWCTGICLLIWLSFSSCGKVLVVGQTTIGNVTQKCDRGSDIGRVPYNPSQCRSDIGRVPYQAHHNADIPRVLEPSFWSIRY